MQHFDWCIRWDGRNVWSQMNDHVWPCVQLKNIRSRRQEMDVIKSPHSCVMYYNVQLFKQFDRISPNRTQNCAMKLENARMDSLAWMVSWSLQKLGLMQMTVTPTEKIALGMSPITSYAVTAYICILVFNVQINVARWPSSEFWSTIHIQVFGGRSTRRTWNSVYSVALMLNLPIRMSFIWFFR